MGKNYDEEVAVHFVKAIGLQARRNIIATIRTAGTTKTGTRGSD